MNLSCSVAGPKRKVERPEIEVHEALERGEPSTKHRRCWVVGSCREEGTKEREVGRVAVLIPRQSSGGLVHAPCLMQDPVS